jgi:hypothetical protein
MFGDKTVKTFSEDDVKRIASEAVTAATAPLQTKITQLETSVAEQKTQFSEREGKIATSETKQRAIEAVNDLKTKGRWVPAFDKAGLPLVFEELAKISTTIEFGEAGSDGKKPQVAPLQLFVTFMEGLPKIVPDGRTFDPSARTTAGKTSGDPLTDAAKARQKEKGISFSEALDQVVAENPELARPAQRAGAV